MTTGFLLFLLVLSVMNELVLHCKMVQGVASQDHTKKSVCLLLMHDEYNSSAGLQKSCSNYSFFLEF